MIKFGTLGAARITPLALLNPCAAEPRASVEVVAARSRTRAEAFAQAHQIPQVLDNYAEVIQHADVAAVYIPLPITQHHQWTIKALQAGKHVLCEKSFASNASEAEQMRDAARGTGLVLMDAYHYRYHPLFSRAREIYSAGLLGTIREVHAKFHVPVTDPKDIRMNYATGGGVTMDIGCYPISWVRHITASEPLSLTAAAVVGPPNVDVCLTTRMTLPGDIVATTSGDMRAAAAFVATIEVIGDLGRMLVNNPIAPHMGNSLTLTLQHAEPSVEHFSRRPTYSYQLDAFLNAIEAGQPVLTDANDAVAQMRVIDQCYRAAGLPIRGLALLPAL